MTTTQQALGQKILVCVFYLSVRLDVAEYYGRKLRLICKYKEVRMSTIGKSLKKLL